MSAGPILSQLSLGGVRVFLLDFAGTTATTLASMAHRILGPDELALCRSFSLERKQHEWLAGRLVAKAALQDRVECGSSSVRKLTRLQVLPVSGRSGPVRSPVGGALSISHSGTLAAAVHSTRPIGVDIEQIRDFRPGLMRQLVSPKEAGLLGAEITNNAVLTMLWSTKEAVLKARHSKSLTEIRRIVWHGWGGKGAAIVADNGHSVPFVRAGILRNHAVAIASHDLKWGAQDE